MKDELEQGLKALSEIENVPCIGTTSTVGSWQSKRPAIEYRWAMSNLTIFRVITTPL